MATEDPDDFSGDEDVGKVGYAQGSDGDEPPERIISTDWCLSSEEMDFLNSLTNRLINQAYSFAIELNREAFVIHANSRSS